MSNEKSTYVDLLFYICIPFNRHMSNVFFLKYFEDDDDLFSEL